MNRKDRKRSKMHLGTSVQVSKKRDRHTDLRPSFLSCSCGGRFAIGHRPMRVRSLYASAPDAASLGVKLCAQLSGSRPSLLVWLANSREPRPLAEALSKCSAAVIGGVSHSGLIAGRVERMAHPMGEVEHATALAVELPPAATATTFHSHDDVGLPALPEGAWEAFASASAASSPHMLLLAAPPRQGSFHLESWLHRLDVALPWCSKARTRKEALTHTRARAPHFSTRAPLLFELVFCFFLFRPHVAHSPVLFI